MGYNFEKFDVGDTIKQALARGKITNTRHLLEKCATPTGRSETSRSTGLTEAELHRLACFADLLRIKDVGPGAARLLVAAGVTTVIGLRAAEAAALKRTLDAANARSKIPIVDRLPNLEAVSAWIERAAATPLVLVD